MASPASRGARVVLALLLTACTKTGPASAVPSPEQALLALANARPVPEALRSKFGFKVKSTLFKGSTNGVLIVDRPGKGHLAVLAPIGGPLLTLHTDGTALSAVDRPNRVHRFTPDADTTLRDATEGLAGVDELLGLLVGDLALQGLAITERSRTEAGDLSLVLDGPRDTTVGLTLDDPLGTPIDLAISDAAGTTLLTAAYGPFEALDDTAESPTYMPSEVSVSMARFELTLDVKFRKWDVLGDDVPDVFGLDAPGNFPTLPLDLAILSAPTGESGDTAEEP